MKKYKKNFFFNRDRIIKLILDMFLDIKTAKKFLNIITD